MHNRLHDYLSVVAIGSSRTLAARQQLLQPLPDHLDQLVRAWRIDRTACVVRQRRTRLCGGARVLRFLPTPIVMVARPGLMPASPRRPAQECRCTALEAQDQLPEQVPNFTTT